MMSVQFPRMERYNPEWILSGVSGGANPLLLTEWLCEVMDLRPGMRILDLGCGRALSSIFLHKEFDVQVWATDLWFSVSENYERIRDAAAGHAVFPIHADARQLPFATGFFDAIISIDSYIYYGTDDRYLNYLARFVKPGGQIGIAGSGLMHEIDGEIPEHLKSWWNPELWCLHSANWWRRHWERTGIMKIQTANAMPEGWTQWLNWHKMIAPDNQLEIETLSADKGRYLGYVRIAGTLNPNILLEDPIVSIPPAYIYKPMFREKT